MNDKLKEVIDVIKRIRSWQESGDMVNPPHSTKEWKKAIDTVVAELEKPLPTLEQSDDKRLLFSAYLQGKRDQIYWATKWEELKPIGKYRMIKQFLNWYQTLKLKEIGQ